MVGEVTGKSQLIVSDFCQFYIDFQDYEVRLGLGLGKGGIVLGMELGTKSTWELPGREGWDGWWGVLAIDSWILVILF